MSALSTYIQAILANRKRTCNRFENTVLHTESSVPNIRKLTCIVAEKNVTKIFKNEKIVKSCYKKWKYRIH